MTLSTWEIVGLAFIGLVFIMLVIQYRRDRGRRIKVQTLFDTETNLKHHIFMYNEAEARGELDTWKNENRDTCPEYPCVLWDEFIKNKVGVSQSQWEFMKHEMGRKRYYR